VSKRLDGKIALVTGGGTGIGAAIAKRFAAEGARVVICGRRAKLLERVVGEIRAAGGSAEGTPLDLTDEASARGFVKNAAARHGRIDVLVNNAMQLVVKPVAEMTSGEWRKSLSVALDAVFFTMNEAMPLMLGQGSGSIVNISSLAAHTSDPGLGGYSAAKAGLESLSRAAAIEGAARNVRVNVLTLGMHASESGEQAYGDPEARRAMERRIALGRFGRPEEAAAAALFLASDEASFVTGATLIHDGGQSASLGSPRLESGHKN
jgi:meso-butanediol dehydrogenase / (S,S)-butanediol dehydrogenase / diacetyl reductase